MSEITTIKKYNIILEEFNFAQDKTLTAYDRVLQDRLNLSPKQIIRLLEDLEQEFDAIIELPNKRRKTFKLIKAIDLFVETFEQTDNIDWFFHMAHDADPEIFKELENYTNQNKNVYKFINTPFEDINDLKSNDVIKKLEVAIKNREYRKLKFYNHDEEYDNTKCLKLLYIDNNWYLAAVGEDDILRLSRVSFIEKVDYATNMGSYQSQSVKKQVDFIENNIQNSMTLYGKPVQKATIKADASRAKYFDKGMKKFLPSQEFQKKLDDGSVVFTLKYTQPLEILPFIQKWIPYLVVLEPLELREEFLNNLNEMLSNNKD